MNKQQLARIRKESKDLLEQSSRSHVNCVRWTSNQNQNRIHETIKSDICWALHQRGISYVTEAEFKGGKGIADILVLDKGIAIEIMYSEKDKSIEKKAKIYPVPIEKFKIGMNINDFLGGLGL